MTTIETPEPPQPDNDDDDVELPGDEDVPELDYMTPTQALADPTVDARETE
jgi:hypothetical protein